MFIEKIFGKYKGEYNEFHFLVEHHREGRDSLTDIIYRPFSAIEEVGRLSIVKRISRTMTCDTPDEDNFSYNGSFKLRADSNYNKHTSLRSENTIVRDSVIMQIDSVKITACEQDYFFLRKNCNAEVSQFFINVVVDYDGYKYSRNIPMESFTPYSGDFEEPFLVNRKGLLHWCG